MGTYWAFDVHWFSIDFPIETGETDNIAIFNYTADITKNYNIFQAIQWFQLKSNCHFMATKGEKCDIMHWIWTWRLIVYSYTIYLYTLFIHVLWPRFSEHFMNLMHSHPFNTLRIFECVRLFQWTIDDFCILIMILVHIISQLGN